ncbi:MULTISPECIES: hypothetical protein [Shewanella]|uniref:Uncharacterized protein n=1 Tax=Shewanella japonica TaxID=93973 RepID=A0ABN4YPV1_9GAMM|nr:MULTISPECIES: hypothetical protein [Shewanella]ARD24165.1 hypothetical protein SJ2017_3936 [Shewanella japonica]KPZ67924.1 hypothetical protein AN944_03838 [Shewanella sp. P1-14-1]MBQ4891414.1 hypothetical protein [Shewanella sp. MMG014]
MMCSQSKMSTHQTGKVTLKPVVSLFSTSALMLVAYFVMSDNSNPLLADNCACTENVTYNSSLPSSHPNNRCAVESDNVSWGDWVTGKSRSSQFHFLDLLELLHNSDKSKPISDMPTNNPNSI